MAPNTKSNGLKRKFLESDESELESSESDRLVRLVRNDPVLAPSKPKRSAKNSESVTKCGHCRQLLDDPDLKVCSGDPEDALEEQLALTHPKISISSELDYGIYEAVINEKPQIKITNVCVYDARGHLCRLDMGLLERGVKLYFSGYVKPIFDEDPDMKGGVATKRMGPLEQWWISGYNGGSDNVVIGVSTELADYYIMKPTHSYEPYLDAMKEKVYLTKIVIEYLNDNPNATYEDLVNKIQTTNPPHGLTAFTENSLLRHAHFIVDQIRSLDDTATDYDILLLETPCVVSLVDLAGCPTDKSPFLNGVGSSIVRVRKKIHSLATSTPLVHSMFENFFNKQLDSKCIENENLTTSDDDNNNEGNGQRQERRCRVCEACQRNDCGKCYACLDMVKFGGLGKRKKSCRERRCPYVRVPATLSEEYDSDVGETRELLPGITEEQVISDEALIASQRKFHSHNSKRQATKLEWIGDIIKEESQRKYYAAVSINGAEVKWGDCVLVAPESPSTPLFIARVIYMWESPFGEKKFHAHWFTRGSDTVLGETAENGEVFVVYECEDSNLECVIRKCVVIKKTPPEDWSRIGGLKLSSNPKSEDGVHPDGETVFFYQKMYTPNTARFEDPPELEIPKDIDNILHLCISCKKIIEKRREEIPVLGRPLQKIDGKIFYNSVLWQKEDFKVGDCIFLLPEAFEFNAKQCIKKSLCKEEHYDEDRYPERYRKNDCFSASLLVASEPFRIAYIKSIYVPSDVSKLSRNLEIRLVVKKFYRPENTHKGNLLALGTDINLLYWSDEEAVVKFRMVQGKCYVVYKDNVKDVDKYTSEGPYRFYFSKQYIAEIKSFRDPPPIAMRLGGPDMISRKKSPLSLDKDLPKTYPRIKRPLRSLDVFAGCGGLTEGLHQAGIAEALWAVEFEESAARAFKMNNRNCTVLVEDCNKLLKLVMDGAQETPSGQKLPQKGEVEFLCGGPPCQGFSRMNRFNSGQYSAFKNSLVVSFLSYCDYYRPRFFLLENVRNFVLFKRGMVLKLALSCLVRMGYQCTFAVLEAGNYGVPQTRRRVFILAAAPGEKLPLFPEPLHVFPTRKYFHSVHIDDKRFESNTMWTSSAPYRMITCRDSMSDLPEICNGAKAEVIPYGEKPLSHFQRKLRGKNCESVVRDHICKEMNPMTEARIIHVPTVPGSDWRDLPNIRVALSDGTYCKKLQYTHHDRKNGKARNGSLRGVCSCAEGKQCDPMDHQENTLIPWCLPHTANRNSNWAGLYGRLDWDGFFYTTVTIPEPMGKQGRVLHPEQHRVVSVRECARSQGFSDSYRFYGSLVDRHRQVGNAVPPPLAAAIGVEILKAVAAKEQEDMCMKNNSEQPIKSEPLIQDGVHGS